MKKLIVTMWMSLDGFVAGPNGEMDWITGSYDEAMGRYEDDLVSAADTLVLGRVTYDSFAGSWPKVPDNPSVSEGEKAYARKLNAMHKVVFSKTAKKLDWNNSSLHTAIVPAEIESLKREPGKDMLIYGSVSVVQQLTTLGLIDEYQLLVYPVVLGAGKALFAGLHERVNLKLIRTAVHPSGVVLLYYQPAVRDGGK